jgi:hypothetical protein
MSSCVNWVFFGTSAKKSPLNPLKALNRLKSLKLACRFVLTSCDIYQKSVHTGENSQIDSVEQKKKKKKQSGW